MIYEDPDKAIQIGGLYAAKPGSNVVYCFLDIFDKILLVNISDSVVDDRFIHSNIFLEEGKYKVDTIPFFVACQTWGDMVTEFKRLP